MSRTQTQTTAIVYVGQDGAVHHTAIVDSDGNLHVEVQNTDPIPVDIISGAAVISTTPEPLDEPTQVVSTTIVASGTTRIVNIGGTDDLVVHQIYVGTNASFTPCTFDIRFLAGGTPHYKTRLVSEGSRIQNLLGRPLRGATGEDLYINLDVADANIEITVQYAVE